LKFAVLNITFSIYIYISIWYISRTFPRIPGVFLFGNFCGFNLKSNRESILTKVIIFNLRYLIKCRKGMVNNLFINVYKHVL